MANGDATELVTYRRGEAEPVDHRAAGKSVHKARVKKREGAKNGERRGNFLRMSFASGIGHVKFVNTKPGETET